MRENNNHGVNAEAVGPGGLFTKTESCEAGEVATGGGGVSPLDNTNQPLSFVSTVSSIPILSGGTATGWSVTFRNDASEAHLLGWIVYVSCLKLG
jgi:hypothetical protein